MISFAAWAYACLSLLVVLFQVALALGAPYGHLAMGGRFPGRFPPAMRVAAIVQGALHIALTLAVLERAGQITTPLPGWLFWVACAMILVAAPLNLVTPSRAERALWGPVTVIMLASIGVIAFA